MLAELLSEIQMIVRTEGLFDPSNPSIIVFDPCLEKALNMKDLHFMEIRDQILKQVTLQRLQVSKEMAESHNFPVDTTDMLNTLVLDKRTKYIVKPSLMRLLRTECKEED